MACHLEVFNISRTVGVLRNQNTARGRANNSFVLPLTDDMSGTIEQHSANAKLGIEFISASIRFAFGSNRIVFV